MGPFVYIGCAAAAYLLGSIPTGYWMGLARGIDIRKVGSGNIGATNTMRALGRPAGAVALGIDILKGFVAVWALPLVAQAIGFRGETLLLQIVCSLAVISGHNWTIFLKFKGGKGVATSAGAMLALAPLALLVGLAAWTISIAFARIVSLASMAGAIAIVVFVWVWNGYVDAMALKVFVTVVGIAIVLKHHANIRRLLSGTEPRIGGAKAKNGWQQERANEKEQEQEG